MNTIFFLAILRLIPITFVFILAFKHRRPLFMLQSGSFGAATIAISFFGNVQVAGAFSTVSAYALALLSVHYVIEKKF